MPGAIKGQKRVSDLSGLELLMVIVSHVGAGMGTWVLSKYSKCLNSGPPCLQLRRRFYTNHTFSVPRTGLIIPLSPQTPLSPPPPPGLPTYEQALAASGVHDAPPPPYSR